MTLRADLCRQAAIVVTIVALHVLLVALLTVSKTPAQAAPAVVMIVASIPAAQPAIARQETLVDQSAPFDPQVAMPQFEIGAPAAPASCDLLNALDAALATDPAVAAALAPLVVGSPHAIMAWNGSWSDEAAIMPVRRAATLVLSGARADCLDEPLTGPRLMFIPLGEQTVSIALGSGTWRWRDLTTDR